MSMPAGRPTLLTPELAHKIYDLLRHGVPLTVAPVASGVSYDSFARWREPCLKTDEPDHQHDGRCNHVVERMAWKDSELKGTGEFVEFASMVTQAVAEHESHMALLFSRGADRDWKAAEALLRRRYPDRWNTPERVEHSGPGGGPIELADARKQLMDRVKASRARLQDLEVIAKS